MSPVLPLAFQRVRTPKCALGSGIIFTWRMFPLTLTVSGFLRKSCGIYPFSEFHVGLSLSDSGCVLCMGKVREPWWELWGGSPLFSGRYLFALESRRQCWGGLMVQGYLENSVYFLVGTACQYVFVWWTVCGKHLWFFFFHNCACNFLAFYFRELIKAFLSLWSR